LVLKLVKIRLIYLNNNAQGIFVMLAVNVKIIFRFNENYRAISKVSQNN